MMATATEIQPLIERYYHLPVRGNPRTGSVAMTPAVVAASWAEVLDDVPIALLTTAVYQHFRDQERGHYWPAPADLLRVCSRERESGAADSRAEGLAGCLDCRGTGMRTIVQHVWFVATGLRIRQGVAPCDECERGRVYSGTPTWEGATWRDKARKLWKPTPRPDVEGAQLFITGTSYRWHPDDAQQWSPFYNCVSPEEQYGDTEGARRQRAKAYAMQGSTDADLERAAVAALLTDEAPEQALIRRRSLDAARRTLEGKR